MFIAGFRHDTHYTGPILTDPSLVVYRAAQLKRGISASYVPALIFRTVRALGVASARWGHGATRFFQETHPERLFVECGHYCELISQSEQMPRMLHTAIQHAVGRGGVGVVVLPGDVAQRSAVHPIGNNTPVTERGAVLPPPAQVQALAARLEAATRPMLFCGAGARGAHDEVMQLAGRLSAAVGHTLRGKEWIQFDNPYDNFLPQAHTIQIDDDPTHFGRRTSLDLVVHGDVRETLRATSPRTAVGAASVRSCTGRWPTHYHTRSARSLPTATGRSSPCRVTAVWAC